MPSLPPTPTVSLSGREAGSTAAFRSCANTTVLTSTILTLGGTATAIGLIGSATYLTKTLQGPTERLCRRFGLQTVLRSSALVERAGLLLAALLCLGPPTHAIRLGFILSSAAMLSGVAVYDMAITIGHLASGTTAALGQVFGHRQRWTSIMALVFGLLGAYGMDAVGAHTSLGPTVLRSALLLAGVTLSFLYWSRTEALIDLFKDVTLPAAHSTPRAWNIRAYSSVQRKTLAFFMIWSFGFGLTISHGDASLLTQLNWSVSHILLLTALMTGAGAMGSLTWGRLIDTRGPHASAVICIALLTLGHLGYVWTLLTHSAIGANVVMVFTMLNWGIAYAGWTIVRPVLLTDGFQSEDAGVPPLAFYAQCTMLGYVASGSAPMASGLFLHIVPPSQNGYVWLFVLATALRLQSLLLLVRIPFNSRMQPNTIALTLYGAIVGLVVPRKSSPKDDLSR